MAERTPDLELALGLCTFCPSLCRHVCPVATAEGSDTVSPWGMMSLAHHVHRGLIAPDQATLAALGACNACGACTDACLYRVPVTESLVSVRAEILEAHPDLRAAGGALDLALMSDAADLMIGARSRFEEHPQVLLVPGRVAMPEVVRMLFALCDRLDVDAIACGELSRLDTGYEAWLAGDHETFLGHAKRAHAASQGARDIVVMSAETLFLLKVVYPRFGLSLDAEIMHVSELLLPLLSGAVVRRRPGRVGYHESCHLSRHLGLRDVPRQVLKRVLEGPLHELPARAEITGCCGGSGRTGACAGTTEAMADEVLAAAAEAGFDRLVSFSSECVLALRGAHERRVASGLGRSPFIDHAVSLVAEAVAGDGTVA